VDLLAYWRWDNYVRDIDGGAGFHFNSNQKRLRTDIEIGEQLWTVGGRPGVGGIQYVLLACLQVSAKTFNAPGYKYGKHRLWGDRKRSRYFLSDGPDITESLLRLNFDPANPIKEKRRIGQSLQTIRRLNRDDVRLLLAWSKDLPPEPRAYEVADEAKLEQAFESSETAVKETVSEFHLGVSENRRLQLQTSYRRNRTLVEKLHRLYSSRCQICGFDPRLLYGAQACCGHHIVYLSRGGRDEVGNLLLICPNHHEVIHATDAVFDFKDLHYVFPNGRREPLVLNRHLQAAS